jgi:ribosomal protein L11 methylase PrmA
VIFGSPYVMANKIVIRRALKLAGLEKGENFYDLGCGNGDVLIEAAKMGAKANGLEISPFYYLYAKIRTTFWKQQIPKICSSTKRGLLPRKIEIIVEYANIYKVDLSEADVIYCYLMPEMLSKLAPKFKKELKKGSRLISVGFPIKALKNGTEHHINGRKIFIYKF